MKKVPIKDVDPYKIKDMIERGMEDLKKLPLKKVGRLENGKFICGLCKRVNYLNRTVKMAKCKFCNSLNELRLIKKFIYKVDII